MAETQTAAKIVTSCHELQRFVDELHEAYYIWYAKSTRRVMRAYSALQALSLLSGFLTSVLTALTSKKMFGTNWRIVLIVLPSVGSLAATALLQFRVYDVWQLREDAKIAFQDLVIEGRKRIAAAKSEQECFEIHESLQLRATAVGGKATKADDRFGFAIVDNEISFTTTVSDRFGHVIVEVVNNNWRVSDNTSVSWDKKYTHDILEVLDGHGRVVLQVQILSDHVVLQGEWHDEKGSGMRLIEIPDKAIVFGPFSGEPAEQIVPIMKYPSAEYPGQFVGATQR